MKDNLLMINEQQLKSVDCRKQILRLDIHIPCANLDNGLHNSGLVNIRTVLASICQNVLF